MLATVVIVGYSWWMQRWSQNRQDETTVPAEEAPQRQSAASGGARAAGGRSAAVLESAGPAREHRKNPAASSSPARLKGEEIRLETETMLARLSTAGGKLLSWQLKTHRATGSSLYEEMVSPRVEFQEEGPLSVRLSDCPESASKPVVASLAELKVTGGGIVQRQPGRHGKTVVIPANQAGARGELVLTQRLPRGRLLVRRLFLPSSGYLAGFEIEVDGPVPEYLEVIWRPGVGMTPDEEEASRRQQTYQNMSGAGFLTRQDLVRITEGKKLLDKPSVKTGESPFWAAAYNKYFVAALLPPAKEACEGVAGITGLASTEGGPASMEAALRFTLNPGAKRVRIPMKVYIGPQEYGILARAADRLEKVINFGFFGVIALPLLHVLNFLAGFTKNYGVAIILLTILVRLILWLPSQWGMNQMKRMQGLQPQLKFINEQFKNDPKRKQEEMMRLYRENKVNPVGGCLPIVFQIPVFFALYSVLGNAIELRGAPFAFWVTDLSVKDPYFVLPILVGGTMWLQQAMTPVMGDPQQAKMMRWMSLVFCVMFISMPSGLMLYWLAQNLMQIGQQWNTNRQVAVRA